MILLLSLLIIQCVVVSQFSHPPPIAIYLSFLDSFAIKIALQLRLPRPLIQKAYSLWEVSAPTALAWA